MVFQIVKNDQKSPVFNEIGLFCDAGNGSGRTSDFVKSDPRGTWGAEREVTPLFDLCLLLYIYNNFEYLYIYKHLLVLAFAPKFHTVIDL